MGPGNSYWMKGDSTIVYFSIGASTRDVYSLASWGDSTLCFPFVFPHSVDQYKSTYKIVIFILVTPRATICELLQRLGE